MKATILVELQPFQTPNYVIAVQEPRLRDPDMTEAKKYHISDLDSLTLDRLCNQFRDEVFRKAGKNQPPVEGKG